MGRRVERGNQNQNMARRRFWRRGGVLGGGERCGRTDGRRVVVVGNFNKSLLGSAFCSASQKKGAENRWAHFPGQGKARGDVEGRGN